MAAVVLAAGRGSRMQAKSLPKVCFPVLGVPAINRSIRACRGCGVDTLVVVVGADGDQVMQTVSGEHDNILYAHQPEPLGTGHAVRVGFEPLRRIGFQGLVWVLVGDKVIDPRAVEQVLAALDDDALDAAFAVSHKPHMDDMGRVLQHADGRVRGIFERNDLRAGALLAQIDAELGRGRTPAADELRRRCLEAVGSPSRCQRFFGRLWRLAESKAEPTQRRLRAALPAHPGRFRVGDEWLTADEIIAAAPYGNESLYCFRTQVLARGLRLMPPPRRGREDYFTNIIEALLHPRRGRPARILAVPVEDPTFIMGFNTPEQLLAIEDAVRRRESPVVTIPRRAVSLGRDLCKPAGQWERMFDEFPPRVRRALAEVYGPDERVLASRREAALKALLAFARRHGPERRCVLARAPGGLNLMGRHIDEFGGFVNVLSVDREVILAAAAREDDVISLAPAEGREAPRQFSVSHEIGALGWDDWLNYLSSAKVRQMIVAARTDWTSPVRAAVLRIQQQFRARRLHGMDAVVSSDIPMAAGFGASSAFMVAASEAYLALNGIDVKREDVVGLCGEGQRFLGRTGPPARHAAAMFGRRGQLMRMRFDPFEVDRLVTWPEGVQIVLCQAPEAQPTDIATDRRRLMFTAMRLGVLFVKDQLRSLAHLIDRLADIQPARLGLPPSRIYEMLLQVPLHVTPQSARRILSREAQEELAQILDSQDASESYMVRDALLFGIAECRRAELFADRLAEADLPALGELMRFSHDSERAVASSDHVGASIVARSATDAALRDLVEDLQSQNPARVRRGQIECQPGRYGSSTAAIDAIVNHVLRTPGVFGAQLSGSGLGGCVMVLGRPGVEQELPRGLGPKVRPRGVHVLTPVAGSGVLRV